MRALSLLILLITACGTTGPIVADSGTPVADAGTPVVDAGPSVGDAGTRETKFIFAFEDSQSLTVTDPDGRRGPGLTSFLDQLPASTPILIVKFWGSSVAYLTPTGASELSPLSAFTAAMRLSLQQEILRQGTPQGARQFVPVLSQLQSVVAADIARGGSANYQIILVSDGSTTNEDQALLCGRAVAGFPGLDDAKHSVRFSAARVFFPRQAISACNDPIVQTSCKIDPPPSMCPAGALAADLARLTQMAALGHGTFKSFEGTAAVDYSLVVAH